VFGVINAALRAFVIGAVVGMLFAPRPGADTRRMLNERISAMINQLLEIAALPPFEASHVATNGQADLPAVKRIRPVEGRSARTTT
jgi:hypothetical protein